MTTEFTGPDLAPDGEYFANFAPAYRGEAERVLRQIPRCQIDEGGKELVDSFYAELSKRAEAAEILNRLSDEERERLKLRQREHMRLLLSPDITAVKHYRRALQVGWVHEMASVSLPLALEAHHLYQRKLAEFLESAIGNGELRNQINDVLYRRLQLDCEAQAASHVRFDLEVVSLLADLDSVTQDAGNLADLLRFGLRRLGSLSGITACLFSRPDAYGLLQIEAIGGEEGQAYAEVLQMRKVPLFEIREGTEAGNGPAGRAWRSGKIVINNSFNQEDAMHPWREEARKRGFRSSVAIPVLDDSGQSVAILGMYSRWPGYFSAPTRGIMLRHVQQTMSHVRLRYERTTIVSVQMSHHYRQSLEGGALQMVYQPIVDMRTGELDSVEALARLRDEHGNLIPPAEFLPSFGNATMLRLFQLGLEQICRDMCASREQYPDLNLRVAINVPPNALADDVYRNVILETLARWQLPMTILKLELLETKEISCVADHIARIEDLRKSGVQIVLDDLGSGHSSLLRLDQVPCDRVKIDQGLVRSAGNQPIRALEFIYYLTLLAHDLGIVVTVEGLEDEGLMEAAAILGVDYGQGYGIAKPMLFEQIVRWRQAWSFEIDPKRPRTSIGALAGYLLWDRKLAMLNDWPDRTVEFIKEPFLVHRYLSHEGASHSELAEVLERTQITGLHGQNSVQYALMRTELIERLSAIWLEEKQEVS